MAETRIDSTVDTVSAAELTAAEPRAAAARTAQTKILRVKIDCMFVILERTE